jgi:hypothetical protein
MTLAQMARPTEKNMFEYTRTIPQTSTQTLGNLGGLTLLRDEQNKPYAKLEPTTGKMYSLDERYMYQLEPLRTGEGDTHIVGSDEECNRMLSHRAALLEARHQRLLALQDCKMGGGRTFNERNVLAGLPFSGRQVLMDLAPSDVHIESGLPNFAGGYSLEDGVADLAAPVIPTAKDSDKYFIWNSANAFSRVIPNITAPGAPPSEVSPTLSNSPFQTVPYALATAITLEVEANADAPLRPYQAAVDRLHNALRLEREYRVMNLLTTSANWSSNNVLTLAAGAQWDNGPASDPIGNIHYIIQKSARRITRIIAGEPIVQAMQRNQAVRSYYFAKDDTGRTVMPTGEELAALFKIPPIISANMKYTSGGALTYVWPSAATSASSVVFICEPKLIPPTDQRDIMTAATFRWTNAPMEGMTVTGGFAVRSYFDQRRGPRGSRIVVLAHNDVEVMTSTIVGGLLTNVIQ